MQHEIRQEEEKNTKFVEKVKDVSKFVTEQINQKEQAKPIMNNTESKINKDLLGKLEQRNML